MAKADPVTQFEDARAKKDYAGALNIALELWAATRDPSIADAIDAVGNEAKRSFKAPEARTNAEIQKQWLALLQANDPVATSWLAESLLEKLPGSDMDQKQEAFIARLKALDKAPPDPRMARALMALVEQAPPLVRWSSTECRKTLTALADVKTAASLDAFIETLNPREKTAWKAAREKLPKPKALATADQARWAAFGGNKKKPASGGGDRDALFKAVLDAPDDDQARAVLADCLQELDDPRGEFIAIQLLEVAGKATLEASKKADALLKKHKKAWLGPLARVTYRATFRRGFIQEIELDGTWKANKKAWADLANDPLLATVEKIHGKPTDDILAQFVVSPAMKSLRWVIMQSDLMADALEKNPPANLRAIHSTDWKRHDHVKRFSERVLPFIAKHPKIEEVICSGENYKLLLKDKAIMGRLKKIEIAAIEDKDAILLWSTLPNNVTTLVWGWSTMVELRRNGKGPASAHLDVGKWATDVEKTVAKLVTMKNLGRIEISATKKAVDREKVFAKVPKSITTELHEPPFQSGLVTGMGG